MLRWTPGTHGVRELGGGDGGVGLDGPQADRHTLRDLPWHSYVESGDTDSGLMVHRSEDYPTVKVECPLRGLGTATSVVWLRCCEEINFVINAGTQTFNWKLNLSVAGG